MSCRSRATISNQHHSVFFVFHSPYLKISAAVIVILSFSSAIADAQLRFTDVTATTGIRFHHEDGRSGAHYFLETLGAGAAWFDYDQDGDIDIYFVNGADLPGMKSDVPPTNALFRNNGDGTFTNVTDDAGVGDSGYGFSCAVGDYDNNGFPDLYITNFGANVLYQNNGSGTFSDVTAQAGVGDSLWGASSAFADYDNDGYLDLFVANYVQFEVDSNPECGTIGVRTHCGPGAFQGTASVLYRNSGDGTFTDVTEESGVWNPNGKGMGVIWCDYDNDADLDLFVANDKVEDWLYRNEGDGTFKDVGLTSGVALNEMGAPYSSMAPVFGDIDNNGWFDLAITNFQDEPNSVYYNDGDGFFSDITYRSGIGGPSLTRLAWGADFADLDSDGWLDLFVATGHLEENVQLLNPTTTYPQQNQLFLNRGDRTFDDVSDSSGDGLLLKRVSRGAAFGDFDNDGDVDILITNSNQSPDLLRNDTANNNRWLVFTAVGTRSNRSGIGTRIKVSAGGSVQMREIKSGGSYPSHSDMRLHFGLGESAAAEYIEIRWPSGLIEHYKDVRSNRFLIATEGKGLESLEAEN